MIQLVTKVTYLAHSLVIRVPPQAELMAATFVKRLRGGPARVELYKWYKGRSTGPGSQSHHLWGHAAQIGEHLGYDRREMLYLIAEMTPQWPMAVYHDHGIPASEATIDSATASAAIDVCHRIAAEEGIMLIEEASE